MSNNLVLRHRIPADANTFYHATTDPFSNFDALKGELQTDVCVVGGGLTGVSAALNLAKKGLSVALLEAQKIGCGASGRNGGHTANGFGSDLGVLEDILGLENTRILWQMVDSALGEIDENIHNYNINCDRSFGYIYAATNSYQLRELEILHNRLRTKYNYEQTTLLEKCDLDKLVKTTRYTGALFDKTCGQINPLKYLLGLTQQLKEMNVRVFEQSPALLISQTPDISVHTREGCIKPKYVVLAGNAYLISDNAKLVSKSIPVTSFIGVTSPLSAALIQSTLPGNITIADCNKIPDYYQITNGGRMLFGCGVNFLGKEPNNMKQIIEKRVKRLFPQLTAFELDYTWSGLISSTINKLPHIGQINSQIYYAQGFSGHGLVLSGLIGKLISEAITGNSIGFDLISSIAHRTFPPKPIKNITLGVAECFNKLRQQL